MRRVTCSPAFVPYFVRLMDEDKPPSIAELLAGLVGLFRTDRAPMLLSVFAFLLGVGQGWSVLWTGRFVAYDPSTGVLTATLIALIWTAYYTNYAVRDAIYRTAQEQTRRKEARVAILAGVAAELENIDTWAEAVSESLYHVRIARIERIMLVEALRNTALLHHGEVALLTSLAVQISMMEGGLAAVMSRVSKTYAEPDTLSVDAIEKTAPLEVQALRRDITAARKNLAVTAKVLSPEMYPSTKWALQERSAVAIQEKPPLSTTAPKNTPPGS